MINQCDGCQRRLPLVGNMHLSGGRAAMVCTKNKYIQEERGLLTIDVETQDQIAELCKIVIQENGSDHHADRARDMLGKLGISYE